MSPARRWLVVERLAAYAPELNPVEGLWACLKGGDLANRCCDTIDEMAEVTMAAPSGSAAPLISCSGSSGRLGSGSMDVTATNEIL